MDVGTGCPRRFVREARGVSPSSAPVSTAVVVRGSAQRAGGVTRVPVARSPPLVATDTVVDPSGACAQVKRVAGALARKNVWSEIATRSSLAVLRGRTVVSRSPIARHRVGLARNGQMDPSARSKQVVNRRILLGIGQRRLGLRSY